MKTRLNPKQEKFVKYLIKGLNQVDAYQKAYNPKYSRKAMYEKASTLFHQEKVQQRYSDLLEELDKNLIVNVSQIINEIKTIAFANGSDYAKIKTKKRVIGYNDDGSPREIEYQAVDFIDTDELDDESKKAISCIKDGKNGISVETYDKVKALELLGKYKGLWKEQNVTKNVNMTYEEYIKECESDNEY